MAKKYAPHPDFDEARYQRCLKEICDTFNKHYPNMLLRDYLDFLSMFFTLAKSIVLDQNDAADIVMLFNGTKNSFKSFLEDLEEEAREVVNVRNQTRDPHFPHIPFYVTDQ